MKSRTLSSIASLMTDKLKYSISKQINNANYFEICIARLNQGHLYERK